MWGDGWIHYLDLTYTCIKCMCLVSQSCPTLCDAMDCSPPGFSVHGDFSGKNTRMGCHAFFQGIFQEILPTQGLNPVSHIAGGFFTSWATREAHITCKCKKNHQIVQIKQILIIPQWSFKNYKNKNKLKKIKL